MKKFSILEKVEFSIEEIENYFLDYISDKKCIIQSGYIKNHFFTFDNISLNADSRKAKRVTLWLDLTSDKNSIVVGQDWMMTSFEKLEKVIAKIKQFYIRSNYDPQFNFKIDNTNAKITFLIIGEKINNNKNIKNEVNELLTKFIEPLKNIWKMPRVSLASSNILKISGKMNGNNIDPIITLFIKLKDNNTFEDPAIYPPKYYQPFIEIRNEINQNGYEIYLDTTSAYNQKSFIIVYLKKIDIED